MNYEAPKFSDQNKAVTTEIIKATHLSNDESREKKLEENYIVKNIIDSKKMKLREA